MSPRTWQRRAADILEAIEEIQSFTSAMTFEQFRTDAKTLKAVTADLAIIGEAAGHLPDEIVSANPQVPWQIMRAMRNRLIHAYFAVDPQIVWETVQQDLPPLVDPLTTMLNPLE